MIPDGMTSAGGKQDAQQRVARLEIFLEELSSLEAEGALVLDRAQKERVVAHIENLVAELKSRFDIDTTRAEAQLSWGMRIASFLGAVALCIAVFLFFYHFWGAMTTQVQVAILIAMPLLLVAATEFAARFEKTLYFAMLLAIAAIAAFVLDLNVLGSIFNITPSPHALLVWAAFAIALGYGYGLRIPLTLGLLSALAWFSSVVVSLTGTYWSSFVERPEILLAGGVLLSVLAKFVPRREFQPVYRTVGVAVSLSSVFFISSAGSLSYLPFCAHHIESGYLFAGLLLSAGVIAWGIRAHLRGTVNLAACFFTVFLFVRLHRWWWDVMPKYLFFTIIAAIFLGLLAAFRLLRARLGTEVTA